MVELMIMRHAKSDWSDESLQDKDRPLKEKGKTDAKKMGELLKHIGCTPELIISSTAKRAKQTAQIVAEETEYKSEIKYEDIIYEGHAEDIFGVLSQIRPRTSKILIVAHNPQVEEFLSSVLSGGNMHVKVSTAGIVKVDIDVENLREISVRKSVLTWMATPKMFKS